MVFNKWWNKSVSGSCPGFLIRLAVLNTDRQSVKTMSVMLQRETDEEEQSHMLSSQHHDVLYLHILSSLLGWGNIQGKELKKKSTDLLRGEKRAEALALANMTFHDICSVFGDKWRETQDWERKNQLPMRITQPHASAAVLHHSSDPADP